MDTKKTTKKWTIRTVVEFISEVEVPVDATREDVIDYWNPGLNDAKSDVISTTARIVKEVTNA